MVPKRRGQGHHLLIPVAGLILVAAAACVPEKLPPRAQPPERRSCNHLAGVNGFIASGDFEGALKQAQGVLTGQRRALLGDEALMALGLITAHSANPKRDYNKALGYFHRVEKEFPRSPLIEEARIWVSVLESYEKAKQVDLQIEEKRKGLGQ